MHFFDSCTCRRVCRELPSPSLPLSLRFQMAGGRLKVYSRKRTRQQSSGSSAEPQISSSSTPPPPDQTISIEEMTRKMRKRAARTRRSSSQSQKKASPVKLGSPANLDPPAAKRPKLARSDSAAQTVRPASGTHLSPMSLSDANILAGLSPGPPRRQTPVTSSLFAKENRDGDGHALPHRARALESAASPLAAASNNAPSASASAALASPFRLPSSDPFVRHRQLKPAARHSFAHGKVARDRRRPSDVAAGSLSSARRRPSMQVQKKRPSNSWLLSPSQFAPHEPAGTAARASSNHSIRFSIGQPVAFSTPTRARKVQQQEQDMMDVDEPIAAHAPALSPLFTAPPFLRAPSSRNTHQSTPSPFAVSAPVSAIRPDASQPQEYSSPLRYVTPEPAPAADASPVITHHEAFAAAADDDEQRADDEAARGQGDPSPASSGGDELRDMFTVLGLDGSCIIIAPVRTLIHLQRIGAGST